MDYELALACEQAIIQIKQGIDISQNIAVIEEAMMPIIENEKMKQLKRNKNINFAYANFEPHREISKAIAALSNGAAYHKTATEEVRRRNLETTDIMHAIELTDPTDEQLLEFGRELKEITKYRRIAKNFIELSEPIIGFIEKHPAAFEDLKKVQSEIQKTENVIKNRTYTPREKTSMEVAFESLNEKMKDG